MTVNQDTRDLVFGTIDDMVHDLLVYDRREDEELPEGAIEDAIEAGEISVSEIVDWFAKLFTELATTRCIGGGE